MSSNVFVYRVVCTKWHVKWSSASVKKTFPVPASIDPGGARYQLRSREYRASFLSVCSCALVTRLPQRDRVTLRRGRQALCWVFLLGLLSVGRVDNIVNGERWNYFTVMVFRCWFYRWVWGVLISPMLELYLTVCQKPLYFVIVAEKGQGSENDQNPLYFASSRRCYLTFWLTFVNIPSPRAVRTTYLFIVISRNVCAVSGIMPFTTWFFVTVVRTQHVWDHCVMLWDHCVILWDHCVTLTPLCDTVTPLCGAVTPPCDIMWQCKITVWHCEITVSLSMFKCWYPWSNLNEQYSFYWTMKHVRLHTFLSSISNSIIHSYLP